MSAPTTTNRYDAGMGPLAWLAVLGGIPAWLAHLTALASLAPLACDRREVVWVMHALTVGIGAITAWAAVICARLGWAGGNGRDVRRRARFLGRFGFLVAATNLVLVVGEGLYVPFVDPCA